MAFSMALLLYVVFLPGVRCIVFCMDFFGMPFLQSVFARRYFARHLLYSASHGNFSHGVFLRDCFGTAFFAWCSLRVVSHSAFWHGIFLQGVLQCIFA